MQNSGPEISDPLFASEQPRRNQAHRWGAGGIRAVIIAIVTTAVLLLAIYAYIRVVAFRHLSSVEFGTPTLEAGDLVAELVKIARGGLPSPGDIRWAMDLTNKTDSTLDFTNILFQVQIEDVIVYEGKMDDIHLPPGVRLTRKIKTKNLLQKAFSAAVDSASAVFADARRYGGEFKVTYRVVHTHTIAEVFHVRVAEEEEDWKLVGLPLRFESPDWTGGRSGRFSAGKTLKWRIKARNPTRRHRGKGRLSVEVNQDIPLGFDQCLATPAIDVDLAPGGERWLWMSFTPPKPGKYYIGKAAFAGRLQRRGSPPRAFQKTVLREGKRIVVQ